MSPSRTSPSTVRQITIAAMLGTLPSVASAQQPKARQDTTSRPVKDSEPASGIRRVAARAIPRGTTLTAEDIAYASAATPAQHTLPHGVATLESPNRAAESNDLLIGWMTRRMITAGELLRAPAIEAPVVVKSGDDVEVLWRQGGIAVTAHGRATRSAATGDRIVVRLSAQRTIEGSVVAPGRVQVN